MSELPPRSLPEGWYPDPSDSKRLRLWDGNAWTEKTAPKPKPEIWTPPVNSIPKSSPAPLVAPVKRISGTGLGCLVVLGVVVLIAIFSAVEAGINGASSSKNDLAIATCQGLVTDALKAPSTASFAGVPVLTGDEITGSVDSENSFGAQIRSTFHCTVVGDSVRLDFVE